MKDFANILYEVQGPMALITINRADKHNAISLDTLSELQAAVGMAAADDVVRVITITGAGGKAFASGSDLTEVLHRDFKQALEPIVQGLAEQLERTPKPNAAGIHHSRALNACQLRDGDRWHEETDNNEEDASQCSHGMFSLWFRLR